MPELNPKSFALAGGILWAACILITTLISSYTGYAADFLSVVESVYPGYTITPVGSIIGAIYAFIDMFIGMYILIWLYNYFEKR